MTYKSANSFFILCTTLKCCALEQEKQQIRFLKPLVSPTENQTQSTSFAGERSNH